MRILEAVRLRVEDVDFQMKQVTVRDGKGDRYTVLPESLIPELRHHLERVHLRHQEDRAQATQSHPKATPRLHQGHPKAGAGLGEVEL